MKKAELIALFTAAGFKAVGIAIPDIGNDVGEAKAWIIHWMSDSGLNSIQKHSKRFYVIDEGLGTEAAYFDRVDPITVVSDSQFKTDLFAYIEPHNGVIGQINETKKWARCTVWMIEAGEIILRTVEVMDNAGTLSHRVVKAG